MYIYCLYKENYHLVERNYSGACIQLHGRTVVAGDNSWYAAPVMRCVTIRKTHNIQKDEPREQPRNRTIRRKT